MFSATGKYNTPFGIGFEMIKGNLFFGDEIDNGMDLRISVVICIKLILRLNE